MKSTKKPLGCVAVRELLFEYAEDTLDELTANHVGAHIASCDACRQELDEVHAILNSIGKCKEEPPCKLYESVMEKIAVTAQDPVIIKKKRRFIPYGTFAAACAAVTVLVAGRHVIFNAPDAKIDGGDMAVVDIADDTSKALERSVPSNESTADIAVADVHHGESILYSEHSFEDADEYITTTTPSVSTASPKTENSGDNKQNLLEDSVNAPVSDKVRSVIDTVYSYISVSDDAAVIVCIGSDFDFGKPDFATSYSIGKLEVDVYRTEDNAKESYVHYLECLSANGAYAKAAMPSDNEFSVCELYLITYTEK